MAYVYQPQRHIRKQKNKKRLLYYIGLGFLIVIFLVGFWLILKSDKAVAPEESLENTVELSNDIGAINAKYLFSGTVVPARAVENEARRADGSIDFTQPLSKLDTFNPNQYDEWTVDMECPITDANIPYRQQVENTIFNCRPEFLEPMNKYFTIMNLANNHVYDQGKDKFPQMQQYIQDAGIQYLGNQDPSVKEDVCEVMALTVNIQKEDGEAEKGELPMAFCAWHYFEREPYEGEFDVMNEYTEIMPVIGLMQVGQEYRPSADDRQQRVGRAIIDGGAEFVIGNSPHWVQNSDVYKDKLIFYSTGNFIFDQLDAETNRGAGVEANMTVSYDENVAKWLELGKDCEAHYDDCLARAKEAGLTKIQPSFTFGLVASTTGYQQVTQKAQESVQSAIEVRTNWADTVKALGQ